MRRLAHIGIVSALAAAALPAVAGELVDRIVARIESDIITLGEVRELGAFQRLAGRDSAPTDDELLRELIEQWIVANDAAAARFPQPEPAEVDREIEALQKRMGTPEAFAARLAEVKLTAKALRRLVERKNYLGLYLDYKFRPTVQIEQTAIENYYRETLVPDLQARKQPPPPLATVSDLIRELLVQKEISRRAAEWLTQTRAQIQVELMDGGPGSAPAGKTAQTPARKDSR